MDPTLIQLLNYIVDLEQQLNSANQEIRRLAKQIREQDGVDDSANGDI